MMTLLLAVTGFVRAQELTVHDGTTTNSYVPFYGLWVDDFTRSELVYPAAELSSMNGGDINSLSFYKSSNSTSSWGAASFQVYLKEVTNTTLNDYIGMTGATVVYEGSIDAEGGHKAYVNSPSRTYADFVNSWGLQRGDQVTFVTVQKLQGRYEVNYARIVLNPRNADGSGAPMTTEIVDSQGEFPCSNWKNQLNFSTFEFDNDHFNFVLGRGGDVVAAGIIVSRKDKSGGWFRSNCQLVLNEAGLGSDLCSLSEAVEKSYATYDIDMESEFYLNNAASGGTGTTEDVSPSGGGGVEPGEPSFNTTASINGVSQSIAGGSVTATAPITSVVVSGTNLGEVAFTAKVDGTGDAINPTSHDANGASFTGLDVAADHNLVVYRGGTVWFTVIAQSSDDDLEG